jgi:hypothetical protein
VIFLLFPSGSDADEKQKGPKVTAKVRYLASRKTGGIFFSAQLTFAVRNRFVLSDFSGLKYCQLQCHKT